MRFAQNNPSQKFDLIFIDGSHHFDCCVLDIKNCRKFAHKGSVIWIDDYYPYGVKAAVDYCAAQGLIKITDIKTAPDVLGERSWAVAEYCDL